MQALVMYTQCVFEPGDLVEARLLPSKASSWWRAEDLPGHDDELRLQNERGENIYVGANPRRSIGDRDAAGVALARCLFADLDGCTLAEAERRREGAGLPVSTLTLTSGGGVHFYWRLREPMNDLAAWTLRQRAMEALYQN